MRDKRAESFGINWFYEEDFQEGFDEDFQDFLLLFFDLDLDFGFFSSSIFFFVKYLVPLNYLVNVADIKNTFLFILFNIYFCS